MNTGTCVACPKGGTPPIEYPVARLTASASAFVTGRTSHRGEPSLVHAIRPADERNHRLARCHEDERLHYLPHLAADNTRGVQRGPRIRGKLLDGDAYPRIREPGLKAIHPEACWNHCHCLARPSRSETLGSHPSRSRARLIDAPE